MADITFKGKPTSTSGDLPAVGSTAPAFTVTKTDMSALSLSDLAGHKVVLNVFPSVDTGVCAASVRTFNERAAALEEGITVVNISADLPFAQARFCGAEGIDRAEMGSVFRDGSFLDDYGLRIVDGPFAGLAARAVVVLDGDGTVTHAQLVPEIGQEPDYDAAIAAL